MVVSMRVDVYKRIITSHLITSNKYGIVYSIEFDYTPRNMLIQAHVCTTIQAPSTHKHPESDITPCNTYGFAVPAHLHARVVQHW